MSKEKALHDFDPESPALADSGLFGMNCDPVSSNIVVLPIPFDGATSWGKGSKDAPNAIVEASHQMDLHVVGLGSPFKAGIALLPEMSGDPALLPLLEKHLEMPEYDSAHAGISDVSDISSRVHQALTEFHKDIQNKVAHWVAKDKTVATIGGDHSVALGAIAAHVERYPNMGVLQIDAHADLRPSYEGLAFSHACVMHNVLQKSALKKLVQVGLRDVCETEIRFVETHKDRIQAFFDHDLAHDALSGTPFLQTVDRMVQSLPTQVYVSLDIDGLDRSLCPHTGTPVPGGLSFRQVVALLKAIPKSGRTLIGFDLTEVVPGPGPYAGSWDALVAAHLLYQMCGCSLMPKNA